MGISDYCDTVGPYLTNPPIITLPPDGLSTWRPPAGGNNGFPDNFTVGEIWVDPTQELYAPLIEGIKQLDINDLACPTWGLGRSTAVNGTVLTTIGPPWLPLIVPPLELFSLDPTWSSQCTAMLTDQFALTTFALFDPPIALTPATLLLPTSVIGSTSADPTAISERPTNSAEAAKPGSLPKDHPAVPTKKGDPGRESPTPTPAIASADPAGSASGPDSPADPPNKINDPPSDPPSDPKAPSIVEQPSADPKAPIIPVSPPGETPQAQTQGLGAIIYNAFGRPDNGVDGSSPVSLRPQSTFVINTQTFTANPTGFTVNDAAIIPGGSPHTVDGTTISLDQSGVLAIGSSTISLEDPVSSTVLTVARQIFTPNPSIFSIAGTIISAGGSAITVDGTAVSLDESGALAIGSTTICLTEPSPTPSATEVFTAAGQTFRPNPSVFALDGTSISIDGSAVTISGTVISLGQNGVLEIGSSTVSLLTLSDIYPSKTYTVAGQIVTPNPSAFSIAGTTISAGGPAVTVDGTVVSLGQSGALGIGSSTFDLSPLSYTASKAYTVAGQTFTPNPSAFPIANTFISAGGPAATVDGTIISLKPSGTLLINSSTIRLLTTPPPTFASSDIDIDGFDVKAESSSIVIVDGITLTAGAPGVTLSGGKAISLETGGATLDIGTGRFALPTTGSSAANGSSINDVQAFTGGGQGKGKGLGLTSILLVICGICGTVLFPYF